ncbi:transketolase [Candidatus Gottesmanbacteria bacterium]|nr:transketolase [Candidatus Gottesmanbacteria bacterium]
MENVELKNLAMLVRYSILVSTTAAGSGHPTSSLSATDLMTTLFFAYLRADLDNPNNPDNDRVIFSKGHASPLFYALYAAAGKITEKELLKLRTFDSPLEGHPVPRFRYSEAATGSLGQGLSVGVGEALALKMNHESRIMNTEKKQTIHNSVFSIQYSIPRVYVLLGDGELAEGSVWEAAASASFYRLNHLVAICDINGLGQSRETMYGTDASVYQKRFAAFGWETIVIDGHDIKEIEKAFNQALVAKDKPTAIIAKTAKGKGVSFLENKQGWHGKVLSLSECDAAVKELGNFDKNMRGSVGMPERVNHESGMMNTEKKQTIHHSQFSIQYSSDKPTATRKAFGNALVRLGAVDPSMVVLDGDVGNSTYTELFGKQYPERFYQLFIAEQNMVGVGLGMSKRGLHVWLSTFACFLTRAFDQIRMAALSGGDIKICGSHAGVSIGADGGSQMGLEDIAMFRAVFGSTVLYPSDAVSTERLVEQMAKQKGIVYVRTTRNETPILYDAKENFPIGGSKTFLLPHAVEAVATIVAAGITLYEALAAQKTLMEEGIHVRVIDCYSIKPIDEKTLQKAAEDSKAMIVVEDHYPEGGLGEAVWSALNVKFVHLAVRKTPRSGKPEELLHYEEIDREAIVKTVRTLIKK